MKCCKPSCWCRTQDHSSWDCTEDTRSVQRYKSGTCKVKPMTHYRCPCYHFRQPSLLFGRYLTWFSEFVSCPISEPAQTGIMKISRNVPVKRQFFMGFNLLLLKSQLPVISNVNSCFEDDQIHVLLKETYFSRVLNVFPPERTPAAAWWSKDFRHPKTTCGHFSCSVAFPEEAPTRSRVFSRLPYPPFRHCLLFWYASF